MCRKNNFRGLFFCSGHWNLNGLFSFVETALNLQTFPEISLVIPGSSCHIGLIGLWPSFTFATGQYLQLAKPMKISHVSYQEGSKEEVYVLTWLISTEISPQSVLKHTRTNPYDMYYNWFCHLLIKYPPTCSHLEMKMSAPQSTPNFLMVTRDNKCHLLQVAAVALWEQLSLFFSSISSVSISWNPVSKFPSEIILCHFKCTCCTAQTAYMVLFPFIFFFLISLEFTYILLTIQSSSFPPQPPVCLAEWSNAFHTHWVS